MRAVLLLILLLMLRLACAAESVTVLQSDHGGPYREFAEALNLALAQQPDRYQIREQYLPDDGTAPTDLAAGGFVIAVGAQAAEAAISSGKPGSLLCVLLPRYRFEELLRRQPGSMHQISAIFLDQPLSRQFRLLQLAAPHAKTLGVLLGPTSIEDTEALKAAAQRFHYTLRTEQIGDQGAIIPALNRLLPSVELLFALPDPLIFNRDTVRPILLTTYRFQRPITGFSKAYITAGALLGVYSTPAHIARQVGELLRNGLPSPLPPPAYPAYFDVSVNSSVAASLGMQLPDEGRLRDELAKDSESAR